MEQGEFIHIKTKHRDTVIPLENECLCAGNSVYRLILDDFIRAIGGSENLW